MTNYLTGFGNYVQSEALDAALPTSQNSPLEVPYGLYPEQITGTPFTSLRGENLHSWLYRITPSSVHSEFEPYPEGNLKAKIPNLLAPTQHRWHPFAYPANRTTFLAGLLPIAGIDGVDAGHGAMFYVYRITENMTDEYFYNADGEMLFIPQEGAIQLRTEFGNLDIEPAEIAVVPRGIKFQIHLIDERARGYLCENFGNPFQLPELGVMGANALANPRHFLLPEASYEEREGRFRLIAKFSGHLWKAAIEHSPLDVVAWHGNYVPYKYDLRFFNTMNTVSYDHPDPSIFTVLTSPTAHRGVANCDFVIFPKRWLVAEHTFRPPYYHRNTMSELMGLIYGRYDAREGFLPGGISVHNCMTGHGPDATTYAHAAKAADNPTVSNDSLAFLLETHALWKPTEFALHCKEHDKNYLQCWQGLPKRFNNHK